MRAIGISESCGQVVGFTLFKYSLQYTVKKIWKLFLLYLTTCERSVFKLKVLSGGIYPMYEEFRKYLFTSHMRKSFLIYGIAPHSFLKFPPSFLTVCSYIYLESTPWCEEWLGRGLSQALNISLYVQNVRMYGNESTKRIHGRKFIKNVFYVQS